MQIKLRLTKTEWMAMKAVVTGMMVMSEEPEDFEQMQEVDALSGLAMKMLGRQLNLKAKMSMTLTEMEALALWKRTDMVGLPALEWGVMTRVMEEIDRQWLGRWTELRKNIGELMRAREG